MITDKTKKVEPTPLIAEVFSPLKIFEDDVSVFVHGSHADNSVIAFSDIDALIFFNPSNLPMKEFDRIMHQINDKIKYLDKCCHHNVVCVSNYDLKDYNNTTMPMIVLDGAMHVQGDKDIEYEINTLITYSSLLKNIRHCSNKIRRLYKLYAFNNINNFDMKDMLSISFLMPALIFQKNMISLTKKQALKRAGEIYSKPALMALHNMSVIRKMWTDELNNNPYQKFDKYFYRNIKVSDMARFIMETQTNAIAK